jgi:hypothetical protein
MIIFWSLVFAFAVCKIERRKKTQTMYLLVGPVRHSFPTSQTAKPHTPHSNYHILILSLIVEHCAEVGKWESGEVGVVRRTFSGVGVYQL